MVTGASVGIGAACARSLAALGMRVAIGARRAQRLAPVAAEIRAAGGTAFAHVLDVAQPESVAAFFAAVEAELGPVDVAVSNAGFCLPALAYEAEPADLSAQVATNLLGPMYLARRALPGMRARRGRPRLHLVGGGAQPAPLSGRLQCRQGRGRKFRRGPGHGTRGQRRPGQRMASGRPDPSLAGTGSPR